MATKKSKDYKRFKIPYLFSEGVKGLYRNKVLSVASILVLVSCIVVVGLFVILTNIIDNNLSSADELYVVTAYISSKTEEKEILNVKDEISTLDNVNKVVYISKDEALDELMEENEEISSVVDEYREQLSDVIRARLDITFQSYDKLDPLVVALEENKIIEDISTKLDLYHGISSLKKNVATISSALILLLFFVAVFVTMNTVRIGIFYRKDEIALMRYMGATKAFITSPFVIECFFMGALSVCLSFAAEFIVYKFLIVKWAEGYGIMGLSHFSDFLPTLIPAFLCVGVLSSSLSGLICVKKYLNV